MQEPDFWNDQERARQLSQEREELAKEIDEWKLYERDVQETDALLKLAEEEGDQSTIQDVEKKVEELVKKFANIEMYIFFAGKYDARNAYVTVHAGSGGTDAQDWAEMLQRMLLRFAEKQGWQIDIVDEQKGKEAGVKRVMIHMQGRHAYGMMKAEAGVHRLVRISPFDAEKMRHTSFALVEVIPELEDIDEVDLDEKDIRVDTFTSSGHGGQSVNTTYSAVRIVHEPTGIMVSCQNERSQKQNKETAMKILKAKLHALALEAQEKQKQDIRGEFKSAEWGNQILSYVLHPYTMVKDHRTKQETQDVQSVLNGDLLPFIEQYLRWSKTV